MPRCIILLDFLFLVTGLSLWRAYYVKQAHARLAAGEGLRNVLFVGSGPLPQIVAKELVENHRHGRRVVGFVTDEAAPAFDRLQTHLTNPHTWWLEADQSRALSLVAAAKVLRQPRHLLASVARTDPDDVARAIDALQAEELFLGPEGPRERVAQLVGLCQSRGIDVHLLPEHHEEMGLRPSPWQLGPFVLLDIYRRPISRLGAIAKRGMDILGGAVGLLIGAPIILATVIAIKIEDRSLTGFYPGRRVGLKGRVFRMAKFTTMVPHAQEIEKGMPMKNKRPAPWPTTTVTLCTPRPGSASRR